MQDDCRGERRADTERGALIDLDGGGSRWTRRRLGGKLKQRRTAGIEDDDEVGEALERERAQAGRPASSCPRWRFRGTPR